MNEETRIDLMDGKYTVVLNIDPKNWQFYCLRYGEEWQNLTGNNIVLGLVFKIQELEEKIAELSK